MCADAEDTNMNGLLVFNAGTCKKKSYMWSAFSGEFACCVAIRLQGRLHAQVTSGQLSDLSRFLLSRSSEHWWKTPEKPKVTKVCRNKARAPKTYNNGFLSSSSSHQTHLKNNKNGGRESFSLCLGNASIFRSWSFFVCECIFLQIIIIIILPEKKTQINSSTRL